MTKFVGRRGSIAISKETSRGVPTIANPFWVPFVTIDFDDEATVVRETQAFGNRADGDSSFVTQVMGEGKITAQLYDKALGLILASLLGSVPTTTGGGPFTQTYLPSQSNQLQSLSILYQDPDIGKVFNLGVVDSLKITVDQNAIVEYEIGFKSRVGKDWTLQTTAFTSLGLKFLHQHLQFKVSATGIAGLAAAPETALKKLEVTISNNTMFDTSIGTLEPTDVLAQEFSVSGTIELLKQDETYRRAMLDGTYKAVEIKFTNTANSILDLVFPRCSFEKWAQDRKLTDIVPQSVNFTGNYDAANALNIISTATLVNQQSTY